MDRPKLVASDVDGTLLDPMERITDRTARAVARVLAADTPFVLVSGRPPRWIPSVSEPAGLSGYAVCANGAVVYDIGAGRVLSARTMSPIQLADVVHAVAGVLPGIKISAERTNLGGPTPVPLILEHGYRNPWGDGHGVDRSPKMATRAEVLGHPATKLLIRRPGMTSQEMAELVHTVLADEPLEVTYSSNQGLIEITAAGVTKASGLAEVCTLLDLDSDGVVAFGDMPNDEPMLRWAGHGVAMANAHADLLAVADEVTAPNSEDGVAQVLERWF